MKYFKNFMDLPLVTVMVERLTLSQKYFFWSKQPWPLLCEGFDAAEPFHLLYWPFKAQYRRMLFQNSADLYSLKKTC